MDFWTWLASCPVKYEVDSLQGFDGVSVAFYPPKKKRLKMSDVIDWTVRQLTRS
jgi:hypothetical protein